jgi:hypothetical protein
MALPQFPPQMLINTSPVAYSASTEGIQQHKDAPKICSSEPASDGETAANGPVYRHPTLLENWNYAEGCYTDGRVYRHPAASKPAADGETAVNEAEQNGETAANEAELNDEMAANETEEASETAANEAEEVEAGVADQRNPIGYLNSASNRPRRRMRTNTDALAKAKPLVIQCLRECSLTISLYLRGLSDVTTLHDRVCKSLRTSHMQVEETVYCYP